jgi:hypothetical protein
LGLLEHIESVSGRAQLARKTSRRRLRGDRQCRSCPQRGGQYERQSKFFHDDPRHLSHRSILAARWALNVSRCRKFHMPFFRPFAASQHKASHAYSAKPVEVAPSARGRYFSCWPILLQKSAIREGRPPWRFIEAFARHPLGLKGGL